MAIKRNNENENKNIISIMKIISIEGNIESGNYKMYYKLENNIIDDSSYCSVYLDKNKNSVYINDWGQVLPRKGTYVFFEYSQLQFGLDISSANLDFFQSL